LCEQIGEERNFWSTEQAIVQAENCCPCPYCEES
jgi:hypothetical protein